MDPIYWALTYALYGFLTRMLLEVGRVRAGRQPGSGEWIPIIGGLLWPATIILMLSVWTYDALRKSQSR